jgi:hypothetical protein
MGYVQFILESRSKTKTAPNSAPGVILDLPGLKRREGIIDDAKQRAKREYTDSVHRLREMNKKYKSLSGTAKKDMKAAIARKKTHMESLLITIGSYTNDEKLFGFREGNHDF